MQLFVFIMLYLMLFVLYMFFCKIKNGQTAYTIIMAALLTLISGFRSYLVGKDTLSYVADFLRSSTITWDVVRQCFTEKEPLFYILTSLIRTFTVDYTVYLTILAAIFVSAAAFFIHRYAKNKMIAFLVLISLGDFFFSMAGLRQITAIAFLIFAMHFLIQKKYLRAIVFIGIASLFHISALVFLLAVVICWVPLNWGYVAVSTALCALVYRSYDWIIRTVGEAMFDGRYTEAYSGGYTRFIMYFLISVFMCYFFYRLFQKSVMVNADLPGGQKSSIRQKQRIKFDDGTPTDHCNRTLLKFLLASMPVQVLSIYQANAFRIAIMFGFGVCVLFANIFDEIEDRAIRNIGIGALIVVCIYCFFRFYNTIDGIAPFTFFWEVSY